MKYRIIKTYIIDYEFIIEAESEEKALEEAAYMNESEALSETTIDISSKSKGIANDIFVIDKEPTFFKKFYEKSSIAKLDGE